jgi:hypothetical protein
VNFVTNCGGVGRPDSASTGSCVLGATGFGRCTVQWLAGDFNPANPTQCVDGSSVVVMGYTLGEEDFIDNNGNAYFDAIPIDPLPAVVPPSRERETSLEAGGEPYLDENSDDLHNVGEFFVDWNGNGARDAVTTSSDDLTLRPGPYPKASPPPEPPEDDDDLLPYSDTFYNGTACAERLDDNQMPKPGSPNITNGADGAPIVADIDDCSPELIYVWDTVDPLP